MIGTCFRNAAQYAFRGRRKISSLDHRSALGLHIGVSKRGNPLKHLCNAEGAHHATPNEAKSIAQECRSNRSKVMDKKSASPNGNMGPMKRENHFPKRLLDHRNEPMNANLTPFPPASYVPLPPKWFLTHPVIPPPPLLPSFVPLMSLLLLLRPPPGRDSRLEPTSSLGK